VRAPRHALERGEGLTRRPPPAAELLLERGELRGVRELAVEEQVRRRLEGDVADELLDPVAAVGEPAARAVDLRDRRVAGDEPLEPAPVALR